MTKGLLTQVPGTIEMASLNYNDFFNLFLKLWGLKNTNSNYKCICNINPLQNVGNGQLLLTWWVLSRFMRGRGCGSENYEFLGEEKEENVK